MSCRAWTTRPNKQILQWRDATEQRFNWHKIKNIIQIQSLILSCVSWWLTGVYFPRHLICQIWRQRYWLYLIQKTLVWAKYREVTYCDWLLGRKTDSLFTSNFTGCVLVNCGQKLLLKKIKKYYCIQMGKQIQWGLKDRWFMSHMVKVSVLMHIQLEIMCTWVSSCVSSTKLEKCTPVLF